MALSLLPASCEGSVHCMLSCARSIKANAPVHVLSRSVQLRRCSGEDVDVHFKLHQQHSNAHATSSWKDFQQALAQFWHSPISQEGLLELVCRLFRTPKQLTLITYICSVVALLAIQRSYRNASPRMSNLPMGGPA